MLSTVGDVLAKQVDDREGEEELGGNSRAIEIEVARTRYQN